MRYIFVLLNITFIACDNASFKTPTGENTETENTSQITEIPLGPPSISIGAALNSQCSNGGQVYTVFNDRNLNGLYDGDEHLISEQSVCNGINGLNGVNGTNGMDGLSMVFTTIPATANECANGGNVLITALDNDRSGDLSFTDLNLQSINICNGLNGQDGQNGADGQNGQDATISPFTPVDIIMACGNNSPYKEILLRLHSGQVLASFSQNVQGHMTRLAFLPDGTFMNTDSSGCIFTLSTSTDGLTRSISWNNQVQMSWPINQ